MNVTPQYPAEAVSNLTETVDKVLNNSKLLAQNVSSLFSHLMSERQELGNMVDQDPAYRDIIMQRQNSLSNFTTDILSKMKEWNQNMMGTRQLLQVLINVSDNLVCKFANENRLSVSFGDQDSTDAVVPEYVQTGTTQKTEDQLMSKFEFIISRLVDLWRCVYDFNRQLNDLNQNGLTPRDSYLSMNSSIPALLEFIKTCLPHVLSHSVVISKQPPLVVLRDAVMRNSEPKNVGASKITNTKELPKCQTSFDVELKIYSSNTLNRYYPPSALSVVSATLITEEDAIKTRTENNFIPESVGELICTKQPFKAVPANDGTTIWTASFLNMRVRKITREKAKNVENMRYCILFRFKSETPVQTGTNFAVDLNMALVSLPFCVIVNPNQRPKVMPPIFWSRAFSQMENLNSTLRMNLNESVLWPDFKEKLNELFNIGTGGIKLTDDQMNHLARRLFGPQVNYDTCPVTFDIFCKNPIPDTLFDDGKPPLTFWDWFYSFMETIGNKKFRPYWNQSLIIGFVSRDIANVLLSQHDNEPCVLIKFSDSTKGTLVMSFYLPVWHKEVIHMTVDDFGGRELSLNQCFEKLCQQYPYLKKVKYIIYGYKSWERKPISELESVNLGEKVKNRPGPSEEISSTKKKVTPYIKAEWQLCLQHPDLHNFLQNMPQEEQLSEVPNLLSPSRNQLSYNNYSPATSGVQSPDSWDAYSPQQNYNTYGQCFDNKVGLGGNVEARVVPMESNQYNVNDNFFANTNLQINANDFKPYFEGTTLQANQYAFTQPHRDYSMDRLELSPSILNDDEFPDNLNFNL